MRGRTLLPPGVVTSIVDAEASVLCVRSDLRGVQEVVAQGDLDHALSFPLAPGARKPGLFFARQPSRPVKVRKFNKPCLCHIAAPSLKIMVDAITAKVPAFLILTARV